MNSKFFGKLSLALAVGALALVGSVRANTLTVNGILTATSPTFNRPLAGTPPTGLSGVGTGVYYQLQPFYVTASTPFSLETTAAVLNYSTPDDTFVVLYSTAFNPASPLTNALVADDDGGGGVGLSLASATLAPGVQYFAVTTTFGNAVTGNYTETFTASAATVVLGVVPEPSTYALLGVGLLGGAVLMARRRQAMAV